MSSPSEPEQTRDGATALIWTLGLAPAIAAVVVLGPLHPDEVYQSLEPAYWRVHGYGVLAWEWKEGLRNWATPLTLAAFIRLARALTVTDPQAVRAFIALPIALLHVAALFAFHAWATRRARTLGGIHEPAAGVGAASEATSQPSRAAALWATALFAAYGPILLFAGRTLSESTSVAFLMLALERLDRSGSRNRPSLVPDAPEPSLSQASGGVRQDRVEPALAEGAAARSNLTSRWDLDAAAAGAFAGLAFVARYGSAPFVAAALLFLLATRRWRDLGGFVAGGAVVAAALGALDWATWGAPFHSLVRYAQFNVFGEGASRAFGAEPAHYFAGPLLRYTSPLIWVGLFLAAKRKDLATALPVTLAAAYLVAISLVSHKELRFLYPALALLAFAAFPQVGSWIARIKGRAVPGFALAASLCVGLYGATMIEPRRPGQFQALLAVARAPDATGLILVNEGIWGAGGYFFLGKPIPWGVADFASQPFFQQAMRDARINKAVTYEGRALDDLHAYGFRVERQFGKATLLAR